MDCNGWLHSAFSLPLSLSHSPNCWSLFVYACWIQRIALKYTIVLTQLYNRILQTYTTLCCAVSSHQNSLLVHCLIQGATWIDWFVLPFQIVFISSIRFKRRVWKPFWSNCAVQLIFSSGTSIDGMETANSHSASTYALHSKIGFSIEQKKKMNISLLYNQSE